MLNIPSVIRELFYRDSVNKNLRISFPDGESADIVNNRILAESLVFTESVCSQDNLKLGTLELSTLEVEIYNMPALINAIINVRIEIDVSSLTPAEISSYGQTRSDVAFPFYPVALGIFRIYEVKQQKGNIARVTAFSRDLAGLEYEQFLTTVHITNASVTIDYQQLIDVYLNGLPGITGTAVEWMGGTSPLFPRLGIETADKSYSLTVWCGGYTLHAAEYNDGYALKMYYSINQTRFNEYKNALQVMRNYGFDADQVQTAINLAYPSFSSASLDGYARIETGKWYIGRLRVFPGIDIPVDIVIQDQNYNEVYRYHMSGDIITPQTSYAYLLPTSLNKGVFPTVSYDDDYGLRWLYGKYDPKAVLEGYFEMQGKAVRYGRNNVIEVFNYMDNSSVSYTPRYTEFAAIGRVNNSRYRKIIYAIGEGSNRKEGEYNVAYEGGIYDMRENPAINYASEEMPIGDFLQNLAYQLQNIEYVQFELTGKGLPYVQAGDRISITTADGNTVNSIIMRRVLQGIQHLTDTLEARGE